MGKELCQKFTGISRVLRDIPYQFNMENGFAPWRMDVKFEKDAKETPIKPLIDLLTFISDKKKWGMKFRYGHFQIPSEDFCIIAKAMGIHIETEDNSEKIDPVKRKKEHDKTLSKKAKIEKEI